MATFQFVDRIDKAPNIRLDLNDGRPFWVKSDGLDLSPPPLRRSRVSTMLVHGERIPASSWDNRVLKLPIQLATDNADLAAVHIQRLMKELVRETNFLRVQFGSVPYFFRTFAAPDYAWEMPKLLIQQGMAKLEIPAEPFAYGLPETLPTVLISNDPGSAFPLNSNWDFEDGISPWTALGGTATQSSSQAFTGFNAGVLTPDGVTATSEIRSENVPCTPGKVMRAQVAIRPGVTRTVQVGINFRDAGNAIIGSTVTPFALLSGEWTGCGHTATAPALTASAQMIVNETGTPPASNFVYIDQARLGELGVNGPGGLWWNIDGIKGDVETPPIIKYINQSFQSLEERQILVAVRRGPTDDSNGFNPLVVRQMEDNTWVFENTDTTPQAGDAGFPSGFLRTTFALNQSLTNRASVFFGTVATFALRGRYRVFLRYRKTVSSDTIRVQLPPNIAVTLPSTTDIKYADLGTISVPAFNDPIADPMGNPVQISGYGFDVLASRDAGIGNLDMDALVFIPAAGSPAAPGDDRLAIITIQDGFTTQADRNVIDAFTETTYAFDVFGLANSTPMPVAGLYPLLNPGHNRMYFMSNVGPGGPPDDIYEVTQIEMYYLPRYLMIRTPSS